MAYFIVSYDLNIKKDYQKLWDEFDRLGAHKCLKSVYLVEADNTAAEVKDHLRGFIDDDDSLIVVEFSKRPAPYKCLQGTKAWLDERF